MKSVHAALCGALVVVLAVAAHWPSADAGFSYDDHEFVRSNASITSLSAAVGAWLKPFPPEQPERALYRPLTTLSYAFDAVLAGPSARTFHASNLLLYALCSLLLFYVSSRFLRAWPPALFAACLFALHPVHCEVVDSISGRSELLALSFALATLAAFERGALALSLAAYSCALFAKETGVMTLAVLAIMLASAQRFESQKVVRSWLGLWPWVAVTLVYLALRALALGSLTPRSTYVGAAPWPTRVWTFGRVLLEYARLLIAPVQLQPDMFYERTVGVQHAPNMQSALGLVIFTICLALLGALALRQRDEPDPLTASMLLGTASFLLFLVPVSHLIAFGALMAERFLFAPSFGICLALGAALGVTQRQLQRTWARGSVIALASASCLALGARSYVRAGDWHDSVSLWQQTAKLLPDDYRAQNNLARGYLERGELQQAVPLLERSLRIKKDHPPTLNNLGFAYRRLGELTRAEQTFDELVRVAPNHAIGWYNLATLAAARGELSVAEARYQRALRANPNYAQARSDLSQVEALLARARHVREAHASLQNEADTSRLAELSDACRALGDAACLRELHARSKP